MEALIMNLISGAVGGNVAGGLMKNLSLGTVGNSIVGILGGGIGGQILSMLGVGDGSVDLSSMAGSVGDGSLDIANIATSIGAGGAGGGVLLAVVGLIKKAL